ncbi:MAG: NRDE family protein [Polyangiaceae bacterium]
MCLIVFGASTHPRYRLVLAANRDELYARPAERAHVWPGPRGVVAGVDVEAGGTWLGVTRAGRFAALTNYRDPRDMRSKDPSEPSRGALVRDFLEGDASPTAYVASVAERGALYRGFNLIAGDADTVAYTSNRGAAPIAVSPGIHGLSNHLLDTPWPKVERGKRALRDALADEDVDVDRLLAALHDESRPPDADLPDTGVGLALERVLSPMFIRSPGYGTRCTSALLIDREGRVTFVERTHAPDPLGDVRVDLVP